MQVIKQPNLLSLTGDDNSFEIKTNLFPSWQPDHVTIIFNSVFYENLVLGFMLDGVLVELVAKNTPTEANHVQADDSTKTPEENLQAFAQSLRLTNALADYKIEADEAALSVYISNFDDADILFSIPDDPAYDLSRDAMFFEEGVNVGKHELDYLLFDGASKKKVAHLGTAFEKGFARFDARHLANTLIGRRPPNFTTNVTIEDRSDYLAKYFLRYAERQNGIISRYKESKIYYMLDGFARKDKGETNFTPILERVSLLQYSQSRKIGRNQSDFGVFFFPIAMENIEVHTYQYDKEGVMFRHTLYNEFHPAAMSVKVTATGTAQFVIEPECVRYNVQLQIKDAGALLGIEYEIDDNNYYGDCRILYWNRKGGFDVLTAKGLEMEELKTESDTFVSANDGISTKINAKYRNFEFNTGYTIEESEFFTWADMQGGEIHVAFPCNVKFVKMIVEKLDLKLAKKPGELNAVSFIARMAKDDF